MIKDRLTLLLTGLFLLTALVAASCGSSSNEDDEAVASPTAKSVATQESTAPGKKSTKPAETTVAVDDDSSDDEPTRNSGMLQLCLGVIDEKWRQVCAAVASKDVTMCSDMPVSAANGKVGWQAQCAFLVAAATKDSGICDDIATIAPGYDPAIMNIGEWGSDCEMYVAIAAKDASLCSSTQSVAGCEHNVAVAAGEVALEDCLVTDTDCVLEYAYQNQSSEACDRLAGGVMGQTFKTACLAMLSGDKAVCDPVKSVGVNEWAYCVTEALYGQAHPSADSFEFSVCEDDEACLSLAIHAMANYLADH